jgi:murein DD-endopeptidase MepM/ murein hydrolase activator NlpD
MMTASTYVFPLDHTPTQSFNRGTGRGFGSDRGDGTRTHAGCDLMTKQGVNVYAVADGTVIGVQKSGWPGSSHAVIVKHDKFIAVYGEVINETVTKGSKVTQGDVIGIVSRTKMLHFEMYSETERLDAVNPGHDPPKKYKHVTQATYKRRDDLLDPTADLQKWQGNLPPAKP